MDKYKEIFKLKVMLEEAEIPFIFKDCYDGYQIRFPAEPYYNKYVCSVIQHAHSYGHEHDLLELMGLLTREEEVEDSVLGYCNAEDVFGRIKRFWDKYKHLEEGEIC